MYRVIIVDDEPWAIVGIRNAFNWEAFGFEVVAETTSSEKAFELICNEHIDLVVTDIRMPNISGIDLIQMTRERNIDTEFIIISGFAEFSYAQTALRYGALDYCLKPIDLEMAEKLMEKVHLHFKRKTDARNNLILEALMVNDGNELIRLNPLFIPSPHCFWSVIIVYMNGEGNSMNLSEFIQEANFVCVNLGYRKMLYVMKSENERFLDDSLLSSLLGKEVESIGLSTVTDKSGDISKLIKEADMAASRIFIGREKNVFAYERKLDVIIPLIGQITQALNEKNMDVVYRRIKGLPEVFVNYALGMGEVVYLWNELVSTLLNHDYEKAQDMELEFSSYSELKERFENFECLLDFLQDALSQIVDSEDQVLDAGDLDASFKQLVKYVDQNFDKKLYIKEVAAKFLMNQTYCCQMFKKILGKTFSEYVTELRMNKACELFKHTDLSTDEVAIKVGCNDYYYFNKVFKKHCQITPAKYRKMYSRSSSLEGRDTNL